jgi:hypothetical protein
MAYKQLINKFGRVTTSKKVNKLNSRSSYKRTILCSTRYLNKQSKDTILSIQIRCMFSIFKEWAVASHDSLEYYYSCQFPILYRATFTRYCSGEYTRIDVNRLCEYFMYFKRADILERLCLSECDISQLSFIGFLSLESIPLPEGYYFTLKEVDRGVFEPIKFKK